MSRERPPSSSPWFLGALLLAILWWTLDLAVLRAGVPHPLDDTWEDGLVARSLLEGRGFRTFLIFPPLWELRDPENLSVPVVVHGPLLPLLLALPIRLFGPQALDHIAWLGGLFAVLAVVPLFRLAARFFGMPAAFAACALFTLSPLMVDAVNHYVSVVLGAWLLTWTLDLLLRERPRAIAAGAVAGVCALTRPEMAIAAPLLAWVAAWSPADQRADPRSQYRRAWRPAFGFLIAFAAVAGWWWLERWRALGSPFFNLTSYLLISFTSAHPADTLFRDFAATPGRFPALLAEALPSLPAKWAHYFPRAVYRLLTTPNPAVGWLMPFGALVALRAWRGALVPLAALTLIPAAAITLLGSVRLYPVPFLGLYALAASLGAMWMMERLPAWANRTRAWFLLVVLSVVPGIVEMRAQAEAARRLDRLIAAERAGLAAAASARTRPMFSDTPDFVAWTTSRPTVWITREELERLRSGSTPRPAGWPDGVRSEDTWFHDVDPRRLETTPGAPISHE